MVLPFSFFFRNFVYSSNKYSGNIKFLKRKYISNHIPDRDIYQRIIKLLEWNCLEKKHHKRCISEQWFAIMLATGADRASEDLQIIQFVQSSWVQLKNRIRSENRNWSMKKMLHIKIFLVLEFQKLNCLIVKTTPYIQ